MSQDVPRDERIIASLAAGQSIEETADAVGCSRKTVSRRLADPDFKMRLREVRAQFLSDALGRLSASTTQAVQLLNDVMADPETPASVRVRCAQAILGQTLRWQESVDLEARLAALESRL